jgi:hypothetical protein
VVAILTVAAYGRALLFPPTNGDDMGYLSSVAAIGNPLLYFVQDHGHGNFLYRPLTPIGLWLVYQFSDVWALPNQIINLFLHLTNTLLMYRIVRRERPDTTDAVLVSCVFAVSQYTYSAATWVSDRPMLLAGLALLLLVDRLSRSPQSLETDRRGLPATVVLAGFTLLALLSKESGVAVPLTILLFTAAPDIVTGLRRERRVRLAILALVSLGLYVLVRRLIFGEHFAGYSQDGNMLLGLVHYDDSRNLSLPWLVANDLENVFKHMLAPVLPIIGDRGGLVSWDWLVEGWPVVVSTALLSLLAVRRQLSRGQWIAVLVAVANAVTHYALFRTRLIYLAHAAFCLFIGTVPTHGDGSQPERRWVLVRRTLSITLLAGSLLVTSRMLDAQFAERRQALERLRTSDAAGDHGHPVTDAILRRYR